MPQKNNTISFIIVNYNSRKDLLRCLTDLSMINSAQNFEVIIVNNDTTKLTLPKYSFAIQNVYEINKNIGYGAACNIGLTHVTNEITCFLNPDTHSFCNNLSHITKHITTKKILIAPQLLTTTSEPEKWSVGEKITFLQTLKNNIGLSKKQWLSKNLSKVDWVSGAAMFIPTQFIKELSGFDEDFFLYFEDVDLCQRIYNCGGSVHYNPTFYLSHTNGASSKTTTQKQKKCYYNSQDIFFKKHLGATQIFLMRICRFLYTK